MGRVLLSMVLLLGACSAPPATSDAPRGPGENPESDVTVVDIIDGDTIEVLTPAGLEVVRLLGLNAPELDECHGTSASDALQRLIGTRKVTLVAGTGDRKDRNGRLLRYAYVADVDVAMSLLASGDAVPLQTGDERDDAHVAASEEAARLGMGLWAPQRCGPGTAAAIVIEGVEANPPGRDDAPGGGETLVLTNRGDDPVVLDGWVLRDESSTHRYAFSGSSLGPGDELTVLTGCGTDGPGVRYWCADGPVWSNAGDTALLLDRFGNVVDHLSYTAR